MNVGTSIPLPAYTVDPAFIARKAEELGFESIWYAEHPAVPVHSDSPFPSTVAELTRALEDAQQANSVRLIEAQIPDGFGAFV